jgi:hypothetical protein
MLFMLLLYVGRCESHQIGAISETQALRRELESAQAEILSVSKIGT